MLSLFCSPPEPLMGDLRRKPYHDQLSLSGSVPSPGTHADLYCCPENAAALPRGVRVSLLLLPGGKKLFLPADFRADAAVTCGMSGRDTLSFSSIGENSAMLCLMRSVSFSGLTLEPSEWKVRYRAEYSLYRNLTGAFCTVLCDLVFQKEKDALEAVCQ